MEIESKKGIPLTQLLLKLGDPMEQGICGYGEGPGLIEDTPFVCMMGKAGRITIG